MPERTLRIYRGDDEDGRLEDYTISTVEGMVVLDALHRIQAEQAPDLAVRWNCKAGRCGSCSAEVNGKPRLTCMERLDDHPADRPLTITPLEAFPVVRDLVPTSPGATRSTSGSPNSGPGSPISRTAPGRWTPTRWSAPRR